MSKEDTRRYERLLDDYEDIVNRGAVERLEEENKRLRKAAHEVNDLAYHVAYQTDHKLREELIGAVARLTDVLSPYKP